MKSLLPILLLALLTGCAAINPGEPRVAQLDGTQLGLLQQTISWPTDKWWQRYDDPQLNRLIDAALVGSPSLTAAQARIDVANAAARGARAVPPPQFTASYPTLRDRLPNTHLYTTLGPASRRERVCPSMYTS